MPIPIIQHGQATNTNFILCDFKLGTNTDFRATGERVQGMEKLYLVTYHFFLLFTLMWKTSLPFLSPTRREALIFPPDLQGLGARGLGFSWIFPHGVKSQVIF
jgi:hypothetical protein